MAGLGSEVCGPCRAGAPLVSDEEAGRLGAEVPLWRVLEVEGIKRLERDFNFPDFTRALLFTDAVGALAEKFGHHPRLVTEWGRVKVTFWTHKISGLHRNDYVMAAKTDELYGRSGVEDVMTRKHSAKTVSERAQTPAARIAAVEYFKAKLDYESTPFDLKERIDAKDVFVLDVRDAKSYSDEHIPGAVNIPLEELSKSCSILPKDKTIVTYCWNLTCHLSTTAALELAEKGFKVQELAGGIREWKKNGLAVDRK
ncbi:MAG: 4a-hydroxytetrahydrobiopterin dehydratase [Elusimicrobia bacterium]|nr:4a-hydroxytetrahydrobiopterin dehydratase [Elusimicrobiota bacterium]